MSIYCKCIYAKNDINAEPKKCMFMQLKKKIDSHADAKS